MARARPARLRIPPEISPGSFFSAPCRPTIIIFSMTMSAISFSFFLVCSRSGKATLSNRFIEPNSAPSWNSTPNSLRVSYRRRSEQFAMSTSRMKIEPLSGLSRPISDLRNTDFPVPDGPSSAETSPCGSVRVTSPQMRCLPNDFVRSVTTTSTPTRNSFQYVPA